ncbi:MAG: DNA repair protein RadA [SAR202 cluster bacterium Io17-Chloro-G9]|nr:MAG: DNA repair protein RadA [SAR202 cluster bacterium Io17-Chloro-G9]
MARPKDSTPTVFACTDCGHESPKWLGFCPSPACGSTVPLLEIKQSTARRPSSKWRDNGNATVQELSRVDAANHPHIKLPGQELNRVMGDGIVPGSVVLLTGEPGVGKSTLLLQIAGYLASQDLHVLYVGGEESPHQIKLRAQRLGISGQGIFILAESDVDLIIEKLDEDGPGLVIVDSIQTLYSRDAPPGPGSVSQVREAGLRLMQWAKRSHVPVLLSGHVTKDGNVAGPRVLEHLVDVVSYLEAQDSGVYRILRNAKNRFGSTTEVGVFEMTSQGLAEVDDPSQALLSQRYDQAVGAAVVPVLEGSRPLMVEVQALTSPSQIPVPRRVANGIDHNRLLMLAAVASRRGGLDLSGQDIIVSVAGGFRVSEPAVDLPLILAMASSLTNQALEPGVVAFGEVGLGGELRSVPQAQRRVQEAARLGLTKCILPVTAKDDIKPVEGVKVVLARSIRDAVREALGPDVQRRKLERRSESQEVALSPASA